MLYPRSQRWLTVVLFSLDISFPANLTTATTLEKNLPRQFSSVVQCDLLNGLRIDGGVDVLVFNPPYVPTEEDDSWAGNIGFAWKGGELGMQTTWRVLDYLEVRVAVEWAYGRTYYLRKECFILSQWNRINR